jgi:hypothetical protein
MACVEQLEVRTLLSSAQALAIGGTPVAATAGKTLTVTVTALDTSNSPATDYRGTIRLTSSDNNAVLPADYTFTEGDAGIHAFTFTLATPGNQTVSIADVDNGSLSGSTAVAVYAPFTVFTTADSGDGSLRQAILDANASPGVDTIHFDLPSDDAGHVYYRDDGVAGSVSLNSVTATTATDDTAIADIDPDYAHSWWSIRPMTALPQITDPVVIDGYSQSGAVLNTLGIGPNSPGHAQGDGDNAVLRVELDGELIGGSPDGLSIAAGNSTIDGLAINRFQDGLHNGSNSDIVMTSGGNNHVWGNFVGTDVSGTLAPGGLPDFAAVGAPNNVTHVGVFAVDGSGQNVIGTDGDGVNDAAERNVIAAMSAGVELASFNNVVAGNFIGTDRTGARLLGNWFGIALNRGTQGDRIGANLAETDVAGERNVISGNKLGIGPGGSIPSFTNTTIAGNFIGTDVTGTQAIANTLTGIAVAVGSHDVTIGGSDPALGNTIAFNGGPGVWIFDFRAHVDRVRVEDNSLHDNVGLGIDLGGNYPVPGPDGVTLNDSGDGDSGPNNLQNFPDIHDIHIDAAGNLIATYFVDSSTSNATYPLTVDFYKADALGQGQTYLASAAFTAADFAAGFKTVNLGAAASVGNTGVALGDRIVATATDGLGNTSEFSPATTLVAPTAGISGPAVAITGQALAYTLTADDPSLANRTAGFTFSVDWGDGTAGSPDIQTVNPTQNNGGGVPLSHTYTAAGSYSVQVTATNQYGAVSQTATLPVTVGSVDSPNLQDAIAALPVNADSTKSMTVQAADAAALDAVVAAADALPAQSIPLQMVVNLGDASFDDLIVNLPAGVTMTIVGNGSTTVIVGHSPALVVNSGTAVISGVAFTTDTDSPTIRVTGGSLVLRSDTILETSGGSRAALDVSGGAVDLGTAGDPGGNTLIVRGPGEFIHNTSGNAATTVGDSFQIDGTGTAYAVTLGAQFNPVHVSGPLTISGALGVSVASGFQPAFNQTFVIISNDATGAVHGTFAGLTEGAKFAAGGWLFQISYQGGDGNDVTLTAVTQSTTTLLISSTSASTYGDQVTFTATVVPQSSGIPSGTVEFDEVTSTGDFIQQIGTSTVDGNGIATLAYSSFSAGTHYVAAKYISTHPGFLDSALSNSVQFDVSRKSITGAITAMNKVYDGTTSAILTSQTLMGVLAADIGNVTLTVGAASFSDPNAGTGKTVTTTGLALTGSAAGNYVLASTTATTTASITAKVLTATGSTQNTINISKSGTLTFAITNVSGKVDGDTRTNYQLFNGSKFTLKIGLNVYSVVSTASVDQKTGTIYVSWNMSNELYNDLVAVLGTDTSPSTKKLTDLIVSGYSADGNYEITADCMTSIFSSGKVVWS